MNANSAAETRARKLSDGELTCLIGDESAVRQLRIVIWEYRNDAVKIHDDPGERRGRLLRVCPSVNARDSDDGRNSECEHGTTHSELELYQTGASSISMSA